MPSNHQLRNSLINLNVLIEVGWSFDGTFFFSLLFGDVVVLFLSSRPCHVGVWYAWTRPQSSKFHETRHEESSFWIFSQKWSKNGAKRVMSISVQINRIWHGWKIHLFWILCYNYQHHIFRIFLKQQTKTKNRFHGFLSCQESWPSRHQGTRMTRTVGMTIGESHDQADHNDK
jgi:hypothetical protein